MSSFPLSQRVVMRLTGTAKIVLASFDSLRKTSRKSLASMNTYLPLLISDPRYVLLPAVSVRCDSDAFDGYFQDRARELRQEKLENVKKENLLLQSSSTITSTKFRYVFLSPVRDT
jgi:hypothetical protein